MTFSTLWDEAFNIWQSGGDLMWPLAILAFITYFQTFSLLLFLVKRRFGKVDPNLWGHWIDKPDEGQGELGDIIRYISQNSRNAKTIRLASQQVRLDYTDGIKARMRMSTVMISVAPLAGLLGTVIGMLKTFAGLAASEGATAGVVAGGIAEALITTQVGLVIAIPGFVILSQIKNFRDELELCIFQIENSFVIQSINKTLKRVTK